METTKKPLPPSPFLVLPGNGRHTAWAVCSEHDVATGYVGDTAAFGLGFVAADGALPREIEAYVASRHEGDCMAMYMARRRRDRRLSGSGIDGRPDERHRPGPRIRASKANKGASALALVSDVEASENGQRRMTRGERASVARLASFWAAVDYLLAQGYIALPLHAVATSERWTAEEWALVPDVAAELARVLSPERPADGLAFRALADAMLLPRDRRRRAVSVGKKGRTVAVAGPDYGEALGDAFSLLFERIAFPTRTQAANPVQRPFAFLRRSLHRLADRAARAARKRTLGAIDKMATAVDSSVFLCDPMAIVHYLQGSRADSAARAVAKRLDRRPNKGGEALSGTESRALRRAEPAIRRFIARHHGGEAT